MMKNFRLAIALGIFCAAAVGGEHAGGAEKIKLASTADRPDPFSPGELTIDAVFEARPTDAGAGNERSEKTFALCFSVEMENVHVLYRLRRAFQSVEAEIAWLDAGGIRCTHTITGLPAREGWYSFDWDGKDSDGEFVTEAIDGKFHVKVIADSYTSQELVLYGLSNAFSPEIYLEATEFSPPIRTSAMLEHSRLVEYDPFRVTDPCPPLVTLMSIHDHVNAYIDLDDEWHKRGFGYSHPTVYSHSMKEGNYIFVQYWMTYPSDTKPIGIGGNASTADVKHEGESEMFMNVLELDEAKNTIWLRSCTASQHYVGQTLATQARFPAQLATATLGEDAVQTNGTHPRIYVAGDEGLIRWRCEARDKAQEHRLECRNLFLYAQGRSSDESALTHPSSAERPFFLSTSKKLPKSTA